LFTASRRPVHRWLPSTSFTDKSVCLMADNVWNEVIIYVDCLIALCFTGSSAIHAWECMICQQWATVSSSISYLFSVTISEQCVLSWCNILQCNMYSYIAPMWNTDLLESVGENFYTNFVMKVPSRQIVHRLFIGKKKQT
jgi:hypothetical protein